MQSRRPLPTPGPSFAPPALGRQRELLQAMLRPGGFTLCCAPGAPGSLQPRSGLICSAVMRSSERGRGSGKH